MESTKRLHPLAFLAAVYLACFPAHLVALQVARPSTDVTITWDVTSFTSDGYTASAKISNYPGCATSGWNLGWVWGQGEVILAAKGAFPFKAEDCTSAQAPGGAVPVSCSSAANLTNLNPASNSYEGCKGQDAEFQLKVGNSTSTAADFAPPTWFGIGLPGYECTSFFKEASPATASKLEVESSVSYEVVCKRGGVGFKNITILWEVPNLTGDGYLADVVMLNYPLCNTGGRWTLSWTWFSGEYIWNATGATAQRGDCSKVEAMGAGFPYSCNTVPTFGNVATNLTCPVLTNTTITKFSLVVGNASNSIMTIAPPGNFSVGLPGYSCTLAKQTSGILSGLDVTSTDLQDEPLLAFKAVCMFKRSVKQIEKPPPKSSTPAQVLSFIGALASLLSAALVLF